MMRFGSHNVFRKAPYETLGASAIVIPPHDTYSNQDVPTRDTTHCIATYFVRGGDLDSLNLFPARIKACRYYRGIRAVV
jgi:hypothetical protein